MGWQNGLAERSRKRPIATIPASRRVQQNPRAAAPPHGFPQLVGRRKPRLQRPLQQPQRLRYRKPVAETPNPPGLSSWMWRKGPARRSSQSLDHDIHDNVCSIQKPWEVHIEHDHHRHAARPATQTPVPQASPPAPPTARPHSTPPAVPLQAILRPATRRYIRLQAPQPFLLTGRWPSFTGKKSKKPLAVSPRSYQYLHELVFVCWPAESAVLFPALFLSAALRHPTNKPTRP